jgi:hypothetical protein
MIMCFILAWDRRERRYLRNSVSCTKNSKAQGLSGSAPHTVEVPCTILGVEVPCTILGGGSGVARRPHKPSRQFFFCVTERKR